MTLFSDMNPSPPSNGTLTAAECSESEPQTDGSPICMCGKVTFGCSIHPNTRDEWIASMQASLVRTLAALGIKPESAKEREAGFIGKCSELLTSFDPDTSSWRTSQQSLLQSGLEPFSETWPRAGMMCGGHVYQHRQPVPRTTAIGGGALQSVPTPTVNGNYNRKGASQNSGDGLATWPRMWQTPVADDAIARKKGKWNSRGEPKLSAQVLMWPTPQTRGFTNDGDLAALAKMCGSYEEMAGMAYRAADKKKRSFWPTPTATLADHGGRITPSKARSGGTLIEAVSQRMWPTPCSSASKGSSPAALTRKNGRSRENDRLDHAVMASDGGQLNPEFVEWLMGFPTGHTASKPSAMPKSRSKPRSRG